MRRVASVLVLVSSLVVLPQVRRALVDLLTKSTGTWVGSPTNHRARS